MFKYSICSISQAQAALDKKGVSPLAVCLDYKSQNWEVTADLLRAAYEEVLE